MNAWQPELKNMYHCVDQAMGEITNALQKFSGSQELPLQDMRVKLITSLMKLSSHPAYGPVLYDLMNYDVYTFRHSIGVALVARWIGKARGLNSIDLQTLTACGLLHDIGKRQVPLAILNKAGRLSRVAYEEIKLHPEWGFKMLEGAPDVDPRIMRVILKHHEREDGSGYPYGIMGKDIDLFSKITAVADVFHATISNRVYRAPLPVYTILEWMNRHEFGELEEESVLCLQRKVMSLLIGRPVTLSNGAVGRVVMIPFTNPLRPLVEVRGRLIDLQKSPHMYLKQTGHEDIEIVSLNPSS